ncbi:hypothetical protein QTO34_013798, partial [Cnephaeus nilssonii]
MEEAAVRGNGFLLSCHPPDKGAGWATRPSKVMSYIRFLCAVVAARALLLRVRPTASLSDTVSPATICPSVRLSEEILTPSGSPDQSTRQGAVRADILGKAQYPPAPPLPP